MKKRTLIGFVVSVVGLLGTLTAANAAVTESLKGLWVSPAGKTLYVVEQMVVGKDAKTKIGVREKSASGNRLFMWTTRLGSVCSVVSVGDDLDLLFDDGTIVRQSDSYQLPGLPKGVKAVSFVQGETNRRLIVLAKERAVPSTGASSKPATAKGTSKPVADVWALYELKLGTWQRLTELPSTVAEHDGELTAILGKASLNVISWTDTPAKEVFHYRFDGKKWENEEKITLPPATMDVSGVLLGGEMGLVLLEGAEGGDVLKLYQLVKGKIGYRGTLMEGDEPVKVGGPYAVTAKTDGTLVGVWASDSGRSIRLAEWSSGGETTGKVETILGRGSDDGLQQPSWWYTFLPGMILILAVFFRGFTVPNEVAMPADRDLAQYWRRGVAFLIDFIPAALLAAVIWPDYFEQLGLLMQQGIGFQELVNEDPKMMLTVSFFIYGIFAVYCILMEGFRGWTVGKRLMGLEVRQVKNPALGPTWQQVIMRNVIKVLELDYLLIVFVIFFTRHRQRIGDMLAGTVVLQTKDRREIR